MIIKILTGLLVVSFLQTACVYNAKKTGCDVNVQITEQTKNIEPISSIKDEALDPESNYSLC